MSHYIFQWPADMPELTFEGLTAWMGKRSERKIGTTVTVTYMPQEGVLAAVFWLRLYDLEIAGIFADKVEFTGTDDPHMATTAWIGQILRDNAISSGAGRVRRRRSDGPGPETSRGRAGLLVAGYGRGMPVIGHSFPVDPAKIAAKRQADAEWREQLAADREKYAAESALREALKAWQHPVLGWVYALDGNGLLDHGYHWRVVDGSFYETVGFIRDTRVGPDSSAWDASPYPGPEPVYTAFAGGPEHRAEAFGPFGSLHEALAAIAGRMLYDSRATVS